MTNHPNSTYREVSLPSPEHAAYIAIPLLQAALDQTRSANNPPPGDTPYRATARVQCAISLAQQADDLVNTVNPSIEESQATAEYHQLSQQAHHAIDQASANLPETDITSDTLQWYTTAQKAISRAQMTRDMLDTTNHPHRSQQDREARTTLAERLYQSTLDSPRPQPPKPADEDMNLEINRLIEEAEQADGDTRRLAQTIIERYDQGLVLAISPRVKTRNHLAIEAGKISCTPSTMLLAVDIPPQHAQLVQDTEERILAAYRQNEEPSDIPSVRELEDWVFPFIVFSHDGKKIAKHVTEPYPKGYPQEYALAHIQAAVDLMDKSIHDPDSSPPGVTIAAAIVSDMASAAQAHVHDLTPHDVSALNQAMTGMNLSPGARTAALKALFNWNPKVAQMITSGHQADWRHLLPTESALAVLKTAEEQGMDPYGLQTLATALGYAPDELGLTSQKLTLDQLDSVAFQARILGVSEQAISRITDNV